MKAALLGTLEALAQIHPPFTRRFSVLDVFMLNALGPERAVCRSCICSAALLKQFLSVFRLGGGPIRRLRCVSEHMQ
jgi:hypothetical protein